MKAEEDRKDTLHRDHKRNRNLEDPANQENEPEVRKKENTEVKGEVQRTAQPMLMYLSKLRFCSVEIVKKKHQKGGNP